VGHELTGDPEPGAEPRDQLLTHGGQTRQGLVPGLVGGFDGAVQAAKDGDFGAVDQWVRTLIPENPSPQQTDRRGNSQQDLRLTVFGWALGEMVRDGRIQTRDQLVAWLDRNIRAGSQTQ